MNYLKTEDDLIVDFITENELVSEEALQILGNIAGWSVDNMNAVIYYQTGYHDIEQLWNCEKNNYYFSDEVINFYDLKKASDE